MEIVKAHEAIRHENTDACSVLEYPMLDTGINLAIVTISGRYPETGYAVNDKSSELAYVQSGRGIVTIKGNNFKKEVPLKEKDLILLEPTEKYFWEGSDLVLVISSTPAWSPDQHRHVVE